MRMFKNRRGLSPIFATLILIAIAVIAGIVVYMFTSGTIASLTGGGGAGAEKIAVQSATGDASAGTVIVLRAEPTSVAAANAPVPVVTILPPESLTKAFVIVTVPVVD